MADTSARSAAPRLEALSGRFSAPVPGASTLRRQPLVDLLLDPAGPPVAALVAPPGYGKTTLLAHWAAAEPRPVAWLTLGDVDNDPAVLVADLVAALGRVGAVDPAAFRRRAVVPERIVATAVPRLATALHEHPHAGVLVLDDVHLLTRPMTLDVIAALLEHLPPGWRAALAARSEPLLPLARLRAQRRLLELGTRVLALGARETAELAAAAGHRLSEADAAELAQRSEGWAAGIYLALLHQGSAGHHDRHFVDADGPIAAYLRHEVRASLDGDDARFLLETSVLDEVTAGAAESVTGMPDAAARLDRLALRNLMIQPVGGGHGYRYHQLLRDYLQVELERSDPGRIQAVHRRAAAWCGATGAVEQAVRHALAAEDIELAGRLVTAAAVPLLYRGQRTTLERWLDAFGPQDMLRNGPLAVIGAWFHLLSGQAAEANLLADIAEHATWDGPPADGTASFDSQRALLRAVMVRRGPGDALEQARYAAGFEQPGSRWLSATRMLIGCGLLMEGDERAAVVALEAAVLPGPATLAATVSLTILASLRIKHGDWGTAADLVARAHDRLREAQNDDLVIGIGVHAVDARVAAQLGETDRARAALVRAALVRPVANHAMPFISVHALLELARAHLAMSDPAGAQIVIREAELILHRRPDLGRLTTEVLEFRRTLEEAAFTLAGTSTLTAAELRILHLLPTYLSFGEIADRLGISRNTVKTHALSIYAKLWASSRSEAVERAVEIGLLEPYPGLAHRRA